MTDGVESKFYSLYENITSCFELFVVSPNQNGFIVYSVLPDFIEILIKLYLQSLDESPEGNQYFNELIEITREFISEEDIDEYDELCDFYLEKRSAIRNPLHHEATIHRFTIDAREQLEAFEKFFSFVDILFEDEHTNLINSTSSHFNNDYAALRQYLSYRIQHNLHRNEHRYSKLKNHLREQIRSDSRGEFPNPSFHGSERVDNVYYLEKIKEVLPLNHDDFCLQVLNYPPELGSCVLDVLPDRNGLSKYQIQNRIQEIRDVQYSQREIENCLKDLGKGQDRCVLRIYDEHPNVYRLINSGE